MKKKNKIRLQGHEKFALRDGWLNKGLMLIGDNPTVFLGKEAPDIFGIGNNMVKSLRYWLKAFGLIEEHGREGAALTSFGTLVRENDSYLEDIFTIWVLHSQIAKNIAMATSWYMYFNKCDANELVKGQIEEVLKREIKKYVQGEPFSEKSLKSDVDVLLSMYSKEKEIDDPEDKNVSPFVQLGLVKYLDGQYIKVHPDRRNVSEWNVLYELMLMMCDRDSISIEQAFFGEKSISAIYQLTSITINEYVDKLDALEYITVDRTAGLDMIYKKKNMSADDVLREYYRVHG